MTDPFAAPPAPPRSPTEVESAWILAEGFCLVCAAFVALPLPFILSAGAAPAVAYELAVFAAIASWGREWAARVERN